MVVEANTMGFRAMKIFPEPKLIFSSEAAVVKVRETVFFVFRTTVLTANRIVFLIRITFCGTGTNFLEAAPVFVASATSFSITEKIVGGVPTMVF